MTPETFVVEAIKILPDWAQYVVAGLVTLYGPTLLALLKSEAMALNPAIKANGIIHWFLLAKFLWPKPKPADNNPQKEAGIEKHQDDRGDDVGHVSGSVFGVAPDTGSAAGGRGQNLVVRPAGNNRDGNDLVRSVHSGSDSTGTVPEDSYWLFTGRSGVQPSIRPRDCSTCAGRAAGCPTAIPSSEHAADGHSPGHAGSGQPVQGRA